MTDNSRRIQTRDTIGQIAIYDANRRHCRTPLLRPFQQEIGIFSATDPRHFVDFGLRAVNIIEPNQSGRAHHLHVIDRNLVAHPCWAGKIEQNQVQALKELAINELITAPADIDGELIGFLLRGEQDEHIVVFKKRVIRGVHSGSHARCGRRRSGGRASG